MARGRRAPVAGWRCRWCGEGEGDIVLDLGDQPPAGLLPAADDALPDPTSPVRMVLCAGCGLAQLEEDGPAPREVPGVEPQAMVDQGRRVVAGLRAAGLLAPGATYAQFPSPHGGDWAGLLDAAGARPWAPAAHDRADVVLDVFGLMHDADVAAAWDARVRLLGPAGVLVVQYHSLAGDLRTGTWHTLRPGHYGCFSAPVLVAMARARGLVPAWGATSDLQGGTGVLAFTRGAPTPGTAHRQDPAGREAAAAVVAAEEAAGVRDARTVARLGDVAVRSAGQLREYLASCRARGLRVAGYGAASRTPVILTLAGVRAADLVAVADAAPAKQGRRLPVGRVPVVSPADLEALRPDRVVLFVPELLDEVRRACPGVEARGGRWVLLDPGPDEVPPVPVTVPDDAAAGVAAGLTTRGTR